MLVALAALLVAVLPLAVETAAAPPAGAALPAGFTDSVAFSGLTQPTNFRFAPDGRIFVAEKGGLIKVFDGLGDPTPTVFADLRVETYDFWDRGLLGIALNPDWPSDPNAPGTRTVYVAYSRDADIGGTAPKYGSSTPSSSEFDTCPNPPGANADGCVISGRLVKFSASGTSDVAASGPTTLLDGWCQQFPSHSVGDLQVGADGMLYLSGGEGANFNTIDYGQYKNLCGDPPTATGTGQTAPTAEGGALRAQSALRPAGQPVLLSGAVLRLDPSKTASDGFIAGAAGNPFASSTDPNKARLAGIGLRNPYRFVTRPGTNELWIGNVGWATWEAIDRVVDPTASTITNFGWPCYEGPAVQPSYQAANLNMCTSLYNTPGSVTAPYYAYNHSNQVVPGETCSTASGSSITGLAFYPTSGGSFPAAYNGALFF
ncbi:MAG TPA: PQQ-dependent sugar dehydrogenase, partial [Acidimicrobiia bacterium]|nr:PQQ-dependent sugar dehydrogenase [Acidimicrobiia bacterium]